MTDKPTRRDLMKPVHLLGWSLVAALFAGFVTALSTGAFTEAGSDVVVNAWRLAAIVAGITFIVVVLGLALLLLVVDPKEVVAPRDRPVMRGATDDAPADDPGEQKGADELPGDERP